MKSLEGLPWQRALRLGEPKVYSKILIEGSPRRRPLRLGELERVLKWKTHSHWRRFLFALANLKGCPNLLGVCLGKAVFASANPRVYSLEITLPTNYNKFIKHQIESMAPSSFEKDNVFHRFLVPSQKLSFKQINPGLTFLPESETLDTQIKQNKKKPRIPKTQSNLTKKK